MYRFIYLFSLLLFVSFCFRSPINQAPNVAQLTANFKENMQTGVSGGKHSIWAQEFTNSESNESQQPKLLFPTDPSLSIPIYTEQNVIMPNDLNMAPRENESLIKEGGGGCDGDKLRPVQGNLTDLNESSDWGLEFDEKMKKMDENQYGLGKDWVENFLKKIQNPFPFLTTATATTITRTTN